MFEKKLQMCYLQGNIHAPESEDLNPHPSEDSNFSSYNVLSYCNFWFFKPPPPWNFQSPAPPRGGHEYHLEQCNVISALNR